MATVFEVSHRVTGKHFAVKLLKPELIPTGDAVQRFMREAQVAGRFEHPNVVEVYDVGQDENSFYIVMELLRGESLAQRLQRRQRLNARSTAELLVPCLQGVAAAHAAGIIHRDLKPANIFIARDTARGPEVPKVLDFGIAKLVNNDGVQYGNLTVPGSSLGTPSYMAPEQLRGEVVDARADVYAFGVIFYELLAGRRPFDASSFPDLILQVLHETPEPLDQRVEGLPRGMSEVVIKAMQRDREARYPSINALIHAFQHSLLGGRVRQRQDVTQFRSLGPPPTLSTVIKTLPAAEPRRTDGSLRAVVRAVPARRFPAWPMAAAVGGALAAALVAAVLLRPQTEASPLVTDLKPLTAAAAPTAEAERPLPITFEDPDASVPPVRDNAVEMEKDRELIAPFLGAPTQ
jgi:serine/threonine-protein kinase